MKKNAAPRRGKYIVVTRSAGNGDIWKNHFKKRGAKIYYFPTIKITYAKPNPKIKKILEQVRGFDRVIVTSIEGLRAVRSLGEELGIDVSPKHFPPIAVPGDGTAYAVRKLGYKIAFRPSVANSTTLAWEIKVKRHASVLSLRSNIASKKLPQILAARGIKITDLPVYRTTSIKEPDPHFLKLLQGGSISYITFASPSAVHGFFDRVDKKFHKKACAIPAVAIGPSVSKALKKAGFKTIRLASEPTPEGMAEAMI